jgi:hypothetical protein
MDENLGKVSGEADGEFFTPKYISPLEEAATSQVTPRDILSL